MTWVLGVTTPLGFSALISDVQVTFRTQAGSSFADCVQKVHSLGPSVLGGFAGSVAIGFSALARLQQDLMNIRPGSAWALDVISETWVPRVLKHVFTMSAAIERKAGCQIILAAAHPTQEMGASVARAYVYIFRSSHFKPSKVPPGKHGVGADGISSGHQVNEYRQFASVGVADIAYLQAAVGTQNGPQAYGQSLAHSIQELIRARPTSGVGHLLQVGSVTRGTTSIQNHEFTLYPADGCRTEITLPKLARNYSEFRQICRKLRLPAAASIA